MGTLILFHESLAAHARLLHLLEFSSNSVFVVERAHLKMPLLLLRHAIPHVHQRSIHFVRVPLCSSARSFAQTRVLRPHLLALFAAKVHVRGACARGRNGRVPTRSFQIIRATIHPTERQIRQPESVQFFQISLFVPRFLLLVRLSIKTSFKPHLFLLGRQTVPFQPQSSTHLHRTDVYASLPLSLTPLLVLASWIRGRCFRQ